MVYFRWAYGDEKFEASVINTEITIPLEKLSIVQLSNFTTIYLHLTKFANRFQKGLFAKVSNVKHSSIIM